MPRLINREPNKSRTEDEFESDANSNQNTIHTAEWVSPFTVLLLLSGMFFLIYLDRGTIASNGVNGSEPSEEDPDGSGLQGDFKLSNVEDGLLSSMFMVGMSVAIPICSEAIYHVNAFRLLGISLLIWSISTIVCGLSFDFYSIAFCRMVVGVGEAAVISLAPPYIDDHAPPERKTLWLACLFFAVPAGFAAGYEYGAIMSSIFGWRSAFILEGILMSPFVLFCFLARPLHLNMKTATGGVEDSSALIGETRFQSFKRHVKEIFSHRVYKYILAGYISYTAFIGVVAYWGAKAAKAVYDLQDIVTAAIAVGMGSIGTLIGGFVLDKIGSTIPKALLLCAVCSFVPGVMLTIGLLVNPTLGVFLSLYSIALVFLFSLQAPAQASILWCVPPNHRTLANGVSVLAIHLLGDVPAPPLFGAMLDYFKHDVDLEEDEAYRRALTITSLVLILAGVFLLIAAQIGRKAIDYRTIMNGSREEGNQDDEVQQNTTEEENASLLRL
eukprot:g2969.t1